ncbi:hypothetical protein WJX73_006212 [Symbiochloris irregularis]|uniref:Patatin n=1 Tax=Symbiochloris irregularis TaxID=706552 RepID=A0AAW1PI82_9CHLO
MHKQVAGSVAALALGLAAAELYNSSVTRSLKSIRRGIQVSFAAWVEEQGGLPLFTVEGDEPEETKTSWNLPWSAVSSGPYGSDTAVERAAPLVATVPARQTSVGSENSSNSSEVPNFFASTKFFSCLDLKESQELFEATQMVQVGPGEVLFSVGDSSAPGIFIVVEGQLGVFLEDGLQRLQTNTLKAGETVGDLDVLDGANRSATCIALEGGALLTQVSRELFMQFIASKPRTLQIYLHKAIARLWRVAHFMLGDFLNLPIDEVSAGELSLRSAPCPTPAPDVFATAAPMADRPWVSRQGPGRPGPSKLAQSSVSSTPAHQASSDPAGPGNASAAARPRGRPFAPALSAGPDAAAVTAALQDSEIAHSIRSEMERQRQMSLPLALLHMSSSHDNLPAFLKEEKAAKGKPQGQDTGSLHRMHSLKHNVLSGPQATLAKGWDVVTPDDCLLTNYAWALLANGTQQHPPPGQRFTLKRGQLLQAKDSSCRSFYVLLEGNLLAERAGREGQATTDSGLIPPGSLVGSAAYLSSTRSRSAVRAVAACKVVAFGAQELESLLGASSATFVELMLAAARALCPIIRRFLSLGLNRVWLDAGQTAYQQGDAATSLFVVISGRLRLVREDPASRPVVRVEEEVGRGEPLGAVWALTGGTHDTSALCIRDSELVRMSKSCFELIVSHYPGATARLMEGMARRLAAASSARLLPSQYDSMGHAAATAGTAALRHTTLMGSSISGNTPTAARGEIVTIALVPAGLAEAEASLASPSLSATRRLQSRPSMSATASMPIRKLAVALKATLEKLFGPTLHLSSATVEMTFPTAAERMHTTFFRSKITSWMAAQEEDYRFIIMEADSTATPWSKICVSHADCILLVGTPDTSSELGGLEDALVWRPMGPPPSSSPMASQDSHLGLPLYATQGRQASHANSASGASSSASQSETVNWAAQMRRVELVLLHDQSEPSGTGAWLKARPLLARHHHIRLSHPKDMARLGRWMAGKAVGLVLSGGGSRGLAHLGVLHALDDAGIPVDVIGGTSQGAFMAALYAQGLSWESIHAAVQHYARQIGSVRHLLSDLTLPIISVFTGKGFDRIVREAFQGGASQIEDLWLRFFCMSTNLSKGCPAVHSTGLLWRMVRASMTIVGLVPPVYENGELLVDGGYLNNIPVDVMRSMGVDTVVVVDVEDRDDSVWHNLTAYDGGLSGWRLLWDRWCPIPAFRYGYKLPRYNQIINALTWMSHSQNLRRVAREHVIDLYLRPPVTRFRLMDYHFMDRIVRDANRYAWGAISEWQCAQGVTQQGLVGGKAAATHVAAQSMRRARSIHCMTQLQVKQASPVPHSEGSTPTAAAKQPRRSNSRLGKDSAASAVEKASAPEPSHSVANGQLDRISEASTAPSEVSSVPSEDAGDSPASREHSRTSAEISQNSAGPTHGELSDTEQKLHRDHRASSQEAHRRRPVEVRRRSSQDAQESWPGGLLEEMTSLQSCLSMLPDDAQPESPRTATSVPEMRLPSLSLDNTDTPLVGDAGGRRRLSSHPSHTLAPSFRADMGPDPDDMLLNLDLDAEASVASISVPDTASSIVKPEHRHAMPLELGVPFQQRQSRPPGSLHTMQPQNSGTPLLPPGILASQSLAGSSPLQSSFLSAVGSHAKHSHLGAGPQHGSMPELSAARLRSSDEEEVHTPRLGGHSASNRNSLVR